ncbi:MAG TPA: DUF2231 domain-containing protein [Streptosporangiaceae bacterium]|nr:DUF2231 domain-containing protein [Streptosporangiaceae bacterium]
MYSKIKIAGHPIHPMLVAFPIASYVGALVGFAVYAANGHQFWLNLGIALTIVGVGSALLAAIPGLVDLTFGVPRGSTAKLTGLMHAALNVIALGLFAGILGLYVTHWNGPPISATTAVVLSAIGVAVTLAAGFLGWTLVQNFHVGVQLAPEQELAEPSVQHQQPIPVGRRHAS